MELQNSKLLKNSRLKKEEDLRLLEVKQASVIKLLKRECEKLKQIPSQESSLLQTFFRRKQILKSYTFESKVSVNKIPRSSAESIDGAFFKKGSKIKRASNLSEKLKELERRRKEMISLGNSFSISNKTSSQTSIANKTVGKKKNTDDLRRELLMKGRELGNRYSKTFKRSQSPSTSLITVDELDRYHRSRTKKSEFEKYNSKSLKSGDNIADQARQEYLKLINEKVEKMLSDKNRRAGEISRQETEKGQDQDYFFLNKYETACNVHNKLKDGELAKIKEVLSEVNRNVRKALNVSYHDTDEYTLGKKLEATDKEINSEDTSCETLCRSLEAGRDEDETRHIKPSVSQTQTLGCFVPQKFDDTKNEPIDEGFSYSSLKSSRDSSDVSSLTIVPSKVSSKKNQLLTSRDCRRGSVEILRKALQGLAATSFIDDLSFSTSKLITSSSTGANLNGSQEILANDPWEEDHVMVDEKASNSTRASLKACTQSLHKTSTFTSKEQIFHKTMEARRRKLRGDDSDDGEEEENNGCEASTWSDSDSDETVRHVFNFVNE